MRRIFLWLLTLSTLLIIALVPALYFLVLDAKPMVLPSPSLAGAEVVRLQRLLSRQRVADDADGSITVALTEADIATAVNYALQTSAPEQIEGLRIELLEDRALMAGCVALPVDLPRSYVNIRAQLTPLGLHPNLQFVQLGLLTLPQFLVRWIENTGMRMLHNNQSIPGLQAALSALENVQVQDARLNITYNPQRNVGRQSARPAPEGLDPSLVAIYVDQMQAGIRTVQGKRYPILGLLAPAFELATRRSKATDASNVSENTAALVALALHAAEPELLQLAGISARFSSPQIKPVLTLHRRPDLAKHFINSALIHLIAGTEVAELIGMQKEIDDSYHGSGFSLDDLVADKAGIRFAELATQSNRSAQILQRDAASLLYDDQLMPKPSSIPPVRNREQLQRMGETDANRYLNEVNRQVQPLLAPISLYRYPG